MSSKFVSAGVIDITTGEAKADAAGGTVKNDDAGPGSSPGPEATARQAEWAAVERRLQEERKKREEARKAAATAGGSGSSFETSLYDKLQANKAAKQAAFEEASKLKNQFRALDEDEVDFLMSLEDSARAEAERVKRETAEGIEAFRRAQATTTMAGTDGQGAEDGDDGGDSGGVAAGETAAEHNLSWAVRKRKRAERTGFPNLKRRTDAEVKADKANEDKAKNKENDQVKDKESVPTDEAKPAPSQAPPVATAPAKTKEKAKLLVAYDSDSGSD